MSFFTNIITGFKSATSAPTSTGVDSDANSYATSDHLESGWEVITPEETTAFYNDRITLFFGPPMSRHHHILLTNIPKTSTLLTHLATLDPAQRYTHVPGLDTSMITGYLEALNRSIDALAIEASWLDIIKLAITAEALSDSRTEIKALSTLREKGKIAAAPGNALGLFDHHDYAFALEYQSKIGGAQNLMRVLRQVGGFGIEKSGLYRSQSTASRAKEAKNKSRVPRETGPFVDASVYARAESSKEDGAGGKAYPNSRPRIPPSVELLRNEYESNFVRPFRNVAK